MEFLKHVVTSIFSLEARAALARHTPRIVAVTGSVGKTTTKDAIFAVLAQRFHVRKSERSYNSALGVPLAVLGLDNGWRDPVRWAVNLLQGILVIVRAGYPAWLVLEVGADRPGDIRALARWLRPEIVVLTGVSDIPAHIEYFETPQALLAEKLTLVEHRRPGGTVVANGDDPAMREFAAKHPGTILYGFEGWNSVIATDMQMLYADGVPVGVQFSARRGGEVQDAIVYGAVGYPRVYAALAAIATGAAQGISLSEAISALADWRPPGGRLRLIPGIKGSLIIDDTYNSSPAAAHAALDTLADVKASRRIAVLGDMLELGKYSADAHRALGARAAQVADLLVTVGFRARAIAEAALDAGMPDANIRQYEASEAARAGKELERELGEGVVALVKGSQAIRMERTVEEIMAEPQKADEMLVRQDAEWRARA